MIGFYRSSDLSSVYFLRCDRVNSTEIPRKLTGTRLTCIVSNENSRRNVITLVNYRKRAYRYDQPRAILRGALTCATRGSVGK